VGTALCRHLLHAGQDVQPIVCDLRDPSIPGVQWIPTDLLKDNIEQVLGSANAQVVVHLAAQVDPPTSKGRMAMRSLHVDGTERLVSAVAEIGVRRLILCSSAVVYGARAGNPVPLTEEDAVQPNDGFPYGQDKAIQEQIVQEIAGNVEIAIARPTVIYGPQAKNHLTEILRYAPGILPAIDGRRPPLQFVHVDDVAQGLALLIKSSVNGCFNIGPLDYLSYNEVAMIAGLRVIPIPRLLLKPFVNRVADKVPSWARAPDYVLEHLSYPFVISSEKMVTELGYAPQYSSAQALRAMLSGKKKFPWA
jgi:nucleoside-diphosphate-sugar epimerase